MALITCPECNKEISDKATQCIHCGYPLHAESKIGDASSNFDKNKSNEEIRENNYADHRDYKSTEEKSFIYIILNGIRWIFTTLVLLLSLGAIQYSFLSFIMLIIVSFFISPLGKKIHIFKSRIVNAMIKVAISIFCFIIALSASSNKQSDNHANDKKRLTTAESTSVNDDGIEMPNVVGRQIKEVTEELSEYGLMYGIVYEKDSGYEKDVVLSCNIPTGQLVTSDTKIILTINSIDVEKPDIMTEGSNISLDNSSSPVELIDTGEYKYITLDDLSRYHANMSGEKFYTVIEVGDIKEGVIQAHVSDGMVFSNFNPLNNYSKSIEIGDYVVINGEVGDYTSYGLMGKSLNFDKCSIIEVGSNADSYRRDESDSYFIPLFTVTEDVAKSTNDDEISEEEFKNLCNKLDYEDILRNPDSYNESYCKLNGTVNQVIEGFLGYHTIFINDSNGKQWACSYKYKDGESRFLENDAITIYGTCSGISNAETVMGKQVALPHIDAKYIN